VVTSRCGSRIEFRVRLGDAGVHASGLWLIPRSLAGEGDDVATVRFHDASESVLVGWPGGKALVHPALGASRFLIQRV
jgi:hypothetical protein